MIVIQTAAENARTIGTVVPLVFQGFSRLIRFNVEKIFFVQGDPVDGSVVIKGPCGGGEDENRGEQKSMRKACHGEVCVFIFFKGGKQLTPKQSK